MSSTGLSNMYYVHLIYSIIIETRSVMKTGGTIVQSPLSGKYNARRFHDEVKAAQTIATHPPKFIVH